MKMEVHKLPLSPLQQKPNIPNLGFINQIWFSIFDYNLNVNPIQDGGRQKDPPYQFFPCYFYKSRN